MSPSEILSGIRARLGSHGRDAGIGAALVLGLGAAGLVAWSAAGLLLVALALWVLLGHAQTPPPSPAPQETSDATAVGLTAALLEALPAPILALDADARLVIANRRAREFFATEAAGQHISRLRRTPELLEATEAAARTGEAQMVDLIERVPVERHLRATISPVASTDGPQGRPALLIHIEDLTEQEQLAEMRADFVANASHELRTPLTSLKGFVETLQGAAKDDPAARSRFLDIMQGQASRMTRLIDDLLSLSRIEMREHVKPDGTVDLAEFVPHVADTLAPLAREAGITLAVAPTGEAMRVRGDRDELIQVAQNLIENAIKYGKAGGRVDVSMRRDLPAGGRGRRVALTVSDDGPGIAPEHLPRLTERFYRVSARGSREKGGTGLGLAIVKHIVNRHGGELVIRSKIGQGSVFTVLLPEKP